MNKLCYTERPFRCLPITLKIEPWNQLHYLSLLSSNFGSSFQSSQHLTHLMTAFPILSFPFLYKRQAILNMFADVVSTSSTLFRFLNSAFYKCFLSILCLLEIYEFPFLKIVFWFQKEGNQEKYLCFQKQ